jgi:hypothetical protein
MIPLVVLNVLCASGAFLGGSLGGGRYSPPGYAQCSAPGVSPDGVQGSAPKCFLGDFFLFLAVSKLILD